MQRNVIDDLMLFHLETKYLKNGCWARVGAAESGSRRRMRAERNEQDEEEEARGSIASLSFSQLYLFLIVPIEFVYILRASRVCAYEALGETHSSESLTLKKSKRDQTEWSELEDEQKNMGRWL